MTLRRGHLRLICPVQFSCTDYINMLRYLGYTTGQSTPCSSWILPLFLRLSSLSGCALCLGFCLLLAVLSATLLPTVLVAPCYTGGSSGGHAWRFDFPAYIHNAHPQSRALFARRGIVESQFSPSASVSLTSSVLCLTLGGVLQCCSLVPVLACIAHDREFLYSTHPSTRLMLSSCFCRRARLQRTPADDFVISHVTSYLSKPLVVD